MTDLLLKGFIGPSGLCLRMVRPEVGNEMWPGSSGLHTWVMLYPSAAVALPQFSVLKYDYTLI